MKSTLALSILALDASASVVVPHILPRGNNGGYNFTMTANGKDSAHGPIGQLNDGQNRIGGGLPKGTYTLKDGYVWDQHSRACILTPPTTQWQCDQGASRESLSCLPPRQMDWSLTFPATGGFGIDCNGHFTHNGTDEFWACPVNDHGEWNIYVQGAPGQKKCIPITLTVNEGPASGNCTQSKSSSATPTPSIQGHCDAGKDKGKGKGECKPTSGPIPSSTTTTTSTPIVSITISKTMGAPPATITKTVPAQPAPTEAHKEDCDNKKNDCNTDVPKPCPVDLDGAFEFPHLIVPVHQSQPDKAFGNGWNSTVGPGVCTIFNFDIEVQHSGEECSLIFLFPEKDKMETSSYTFSGSGNLYFYALDKPATSETTWNNKANARPFGTPSPLKPGQKKFIQTRVCPLGGRFGIMMCGDHDLAFNYFQDSNPEPIGLYIRVC